MSEYYGSNDFRDYQGLYIEHYGTKGMKWGKRKSRAKAVLSAEKLEELKKRYSQYKKDEADRKEIQDIHKKNASNYDARTKYQLARNNAETKIHNLAELSGSKKLKEAVEKREEARENADTDKVADSVEKIETAIKKLKEKNKHKR